MWRRLKHRCRKYSRPAPSLPSRIERKPLFCVRPSLKRGCPVILSADAHPSKTEEKIHMRRLITAALLALALGSAQAATQMEQLAKQMHPSEFPAQIEKLLNSGKARPKRSSSPTSASARTNAARSCAS